MSPILTVVDSGLARHISSGLARHIFSGKDSKSDSHIHWPPGESTLPQFRSSGSFKVLRDDTENKFRGGGGGGVQKNGNGRLVARKGVANTGWQ
jgi:hypothetical protein